MYFHKKQLEIQRKLPQMYILIQPCPVPVDIMYILIFCFMTLVSLDSIAVTVFVLPRLKLRHQQNIWFSRK